MSKNQHLTTLDHNQIVNREHDETLDAKRVIIVGGEKLDISIDSDKIADAVKNGLSNITIESKYQKPTEEQIQQVIEKNVFIPQIEIKEIEKQVIIPQIEYKTIEIPVITERVVTVDRPVIVTEYKTLTVEKERHYPLIMQICAIVQAVAVIGLILINLFKK